MPDANEKLAELNRRIERPRLLEEASAIVGFDLGARPEVGVAANAVGIRSRAYSYSRRVDSLTVFARDAAYGIDGRAGAWTGAARPLEAACRRIARAAGVPPREIAAIDILTDLGQSARRDASEDLSEPTVLQRVAVARRVVDGVPVWSSFCSVALTREGELGEVELHWPQITAVALREAQHLGELSGRWKPDPPEGAVVEEVDAGIIHSPAIGFMMDIVPVIRVIYGPRDGEHGRKAVDYLDRHGSSVAMPRDIDGMPAKSYERSSPPTSTAS
ncbi:hypothetical protein GCM10009819_08920 [Agromyces tropicus]|uniref:Uncharacterized protein n=1 Tax=Agromyces tropicus TaxID=555371 RepID=A0ABP5FJ95_9MICO